MTEEKEKTKRIPVGTITLDFAGEVIVPRLAEKNLSGLFRRYQALFEKFANMERSERLINYKMINALMFTSYAKKAPDRTQRKELFDYKNKIYFNLANDALTRRKLAFKYLTTKNFRVLEFCKNCQEKNTNEKLERHRWKFCEACEVDRNFYNVLSMHHKFDAGSLTLFLSNDLIGKMQGVNIRSRGKIEEFEEGARFEKFQYNVKNLDAFALESVKKMFDKIMKV